jgi:hypothetical protein
MNDQTPNGMLYHHAGFWMTDNCCFLLTHTPLKTRLLKITLDGKYVTKLDLVSGEIYSYPAKTENGKVTFQVELSPVGSALFTVTNKKADEPEYKPVTGTESVVESTGAVSVKRETDNIMMVNYLDLKTAKSEKKDVYFMNALIGLFNENGVEMGNPWQHKIQYKKNLARNGHFVQRRFVVRSQLPFQY